MTEYPFPPAGERSISAYDGEPAPRRAWVAFVLTLLCPGLGSAYLGGLVGALVINLLFVTMWVTFTMVWTVYRFDPLLPGLMLAAQWGVVQIMLAVDFAFTARRVGTRYRLRDANHWVLYGSVFVFSYALPLLALQQFVSGSLWPLVEIRDSAMSPTLLPGDRVLVDSLWPRANPWRRGDLVAFRWEGLDEEVRIARVFGLPGDEVVMAEGRFFVNDTPVVQALPSEATLARLQRIAEVPVDATHWTVEQSFGRGWAVTVPVMEAWGEAQTWRVPAGQLFVVHDQRSDDRDARTLGAVGLDRVVGRPHLIAYHATEATSWVDRLPYGLRGVAWALGSDADSMAGERSRMLVQASPLR